MPKNSSDVAANGKTDCDVKTMAFTIGTVQAALANGILEILMYKTYT
jgi:hypothetical protein